MSKTFTYVLIVICVYVAIITGKTITGNKKTEEKKTGKSDDAGVEDVTKEFATNYYSKYSRTVDSGYRKAVLDSGFKTVRDDKNLPLTQKVRGQNQYTFYQVDSDIKIAVTMYPTTDYTYLNHSQFD